MLNNSDFFEIFTPFWTENHLLWDPLRSLKEYANTASGRIEIDLPKSVFLKNTVSIGKGTVIDPTVYIEGPCFIGKNCKISHGAYLRPGTVLLDGAVIGHATEVKNSLIMERAIISHFCYVGDSILGPHVNLGAGVKCANLRFDRMPVSILIDGKKVETNLEKMGAILGEGVQIGCNAVLNPGTLIGKHSAVYPLVNVGGLIPPNTRVK